jgi:Ca2+/Na+ antiporter
MGRGTWADKNRRLTRALRQRERGERKLQRRTTLRRHGTAVTVGVFVLGAALLMFPGTRGTGLIMLFLVGLVLYLIIKRKRA